MASVLQLTKPLDRRPLIPEVEGIWLRNFSNLADIEEWLDLRRRAFAKQKLGIGDWNAADFRREFLDKPWWRPKAMWFAEASLLLMPPTVVGTVTLAERTGQDEAKPVVHWLAVLPSYRRRGIGRLLMATLEGAVWDRGGRQIWLETHIAWAEAKQLYEALGYRPVAAEPASDAPATDSDHATS